MRKEETVYVSQLDDLSVLWPGDIRALADFVLRSFDARDRERNASSRGTIQTSRPTVYGLAAIYAGIADIPRSPIKEEFEAHGLYLGATVEFDPAPEETNDPKQRD
jgi:hypothetical protein